MATRNNTAFQWWIIIVAVVSTVSIGTYNVATTGQVFPADEAKAEPIDITIGEDTTIIYPDPNDPSQLCMEIMGNDPVCAPAE